VSTVYSTIKYQNILELLVSSCQAHRLLLTMTVLSKMLRRPASRWKDACGIVYSRSIGMRNGVTGAAFPGIAETNRASFPLQLYNPARTQTRRYNSSPPLTGYALSNTNSGPPAFDSLKGSNYTNLVLSPLEILAFPPLRFPGRIALVRMRTL
jgi:hypothetical protein